MNKYVWIALIILLAAVSLTFYSCECSCQCFRDLGCKILTVKKKNGTVVTPTVIAMQTFCPQTNFYTDKTLRDSVFAFQNRYNTDTSIVEVRDSIYKNERVMSIECGETDIYKNKGYDCSCAK